MPAVSHQIPGGMTVPIRRGDSVREFKPAAQVLLFLCEGCDRPASHGVGVNIRAAMTSGDMAKAGKWYCGLVERKPVCLLYSEESAKPVEIMQKPTAAPAELDLFA